MQVRLFRKEDLDRVLEISVKYASFDSVTRESDLKRAARFPRGFWVAENDAKVIGFVYGGMKAVPEAVLERWGAKKVGYVELMAVVPEWRRRGVGKALLDRLLEEFRKQRVDMVLLDCPAEATQAAKLYTAAGFETRFRGMKKRL